MAADGPVGVPGELGGVEAGVQRACGVGLGVFVLQAATVVAVGHSLYPAWWYALVWPGLLVVGIGTAVACFQGRSRPVWRVAGVLGCAMGCVVTAVATATTITSVLSACSPLVTALVCLLGLLDRPVVAVSAGGVLIVSQIASVALTRPIDAAELAVLAFIQAAALVAAAASGRLLRRAAAAQETAHRRLLAALSADRIAVESRADRREHERELHDTVLNTLTALARASLGDSERLRERCARDARYLRSLRGIAAADRSHPAGQHGLAAQLRALASEMSTPRCRVVVDADAELPTLPDLVVQALTRATREALTNGLQHSGSPLLEVRLSADLPGLTLEVVDEGAGLAGLAARADRFGVRRSIIERMADVGGRAEVRPGPRGGTRVVLTWPG